MALTVRLPLYLSWKDLRQKLGWCYSRSHTSRMMDRKNNSDPFPQCFKHAEHRNSHPQWYTPQVLDWLKRRGFPVPENLEFSL